MIDQPAPIRTIALHRPFAWLILAWRDLVRTPAASLLHGAVVMLGGMAILALSDVFPAMLPGALSGFALIAPVIATGLYELSRRLAAGEQADLAQARNTWRREARPLVALGVLLAMLGTLWVGLSALLVGVYVQAPVFDVASYLRHVVAPDRTAFFAIWVVLGGTGAAIVFCITAVSMPMLLDRDVSLHAAVLTSVKAVGDNPLPMALWAAIIMFALAVGMATMMIGLLVLVPLLGHATWHAYRDLVDASMLPERI